MKPGDYPICSRHSRAAARKLLEQRDAAQESVIRFQVHDLVTGRPIDLEAMATEYQPNEAAQ